MCNVSPIPGVCVDGSVGVDINIFLALSAGRLRGLTGSELDNRSLPPKLESRHGYI